MTKSAKAKSRDDSYRDRMPKKCCGNCEYWGWNQGDVCLLDKADFCVARCGICDEHEKEKVT